MRMIVAGLMALSMGAGLAMACTTTPGTTIIVESQPPPAAVAMVDGATPSAPAKLDLDAGAADAADVAVVDAGDAGDASTLTAHCVRMKNYDPNCEDPQANGINVSWPYGYQCDGVGQSAADYGNPKNEWSPGSDCALTQGLAQFPGRWCCPTLH